MDVTTTVESPVAESTEAQLELFKGVVRSLMRQASEMLIDLERSNRDPELTRKIGELDHCLDFTERLCCADKASPAEADYSNPRLWHRC